MAAFRKFSVRIPEEQHRRIRQYAEDNNLNMQDVYSEAIQSFLDSLQPDFIDYIAAAINNPRISIAIDSDTYNKLINTARQRGQHVATVIYTAVVLFLRNRK